MTVGGTAANRQLAGSDADGSSRKVWKGDPDAPVYDPNPLSMRTRAAARNGAAIVAGGSGNAMAASTLSLSPASVPPMPAAVPRHLQTSMTSLAPRPVASASSHAQSHASPAASTLPAGVEPVLHLDRSLAETLQPRYLQTVGGCVWTNGVDPAVKYRSPMTAAQTIGWDAANPNRTLEFFGVAQHATRTFTMKDLNGQIETLGL